jgi:hypothetical protein
MSVDRILKRLQELGFETHPGPIALFEEELPLVVGAAWDTTTAQLALVVEMEASREPDLWRQLMFAVAGLRHQLAADGPAALGPPLVLMVVDGEGERTVRSLVEEMNQDYAVFTRVDLSLLRRDAIGDAEALDDALAPLLPRCREAEARALEISKEDVRQFWDRLRERVEEIAEELDDMFGGFRKSAGGAAADALIGDLAERPDLPALTPLWKLKLKSFRSFAGDEVDLAPVTVLQGANGSGKSALIEALEICWAGTSQRKPGDVESEDYRRHLPHNGEGEFAVVGDGHTVDTVTPAPTAELVRCVLTQDAVGKLVELPPEARYAQLLTITGLELPEVDQRTDALVRDAKREADGALREAGLRPLKMTTSDGVKHLKTELREGFAARLPAREDLVGLEMVLAEVSQGAYVRRDWHGEEGLAASVDAVDEMLATAPLGAEPDISRFDSATRESKGAADARREQAQAMRILLDAIGAAQPRDRDRPVEEPEEQLVPPISRGLAVRWLSHGRALEEAASSFRREADELESPEWSKRLLAYVEALQSAVAAIPQAELQALAGSGPLPLPAPVEGGGVPEEIYRAAGFSKPLDRPAAVLPALEEYAEVLQRQTAEFDSIAAGLENHPVRGFATHSERVLAAVCRYELARLLRPRKGRKGPIEAASEEVVEQLLDGKLEPVVRELLAALVRFEWYFKPPKISGKARKLDIGGIATEREDLDARLTLNAAERSVVGLAWFLALHLLQPKDRRRVLAIDDASAAFDATNQAGFVTTLRAFVRLVRPQQLVVVSHDDAVAGSLAEELAPVGDWPAAVSRVRCERNKDDVSVFRLKQRDETARDLGSDLKRLGLTGEMPVSA